MAKYVIPSSLDPEPDILVRSVNDVILMAWVEESECIRHGEIKEI